MKNSLLIILVFLTTHIAFSQCDEIEKKVDKFTDEVILNTQRTRFTWGNAEKPLPISYTKVINGNGEKSYFLYVSICTPMIDVRQKGLIILFEDKTKIRVDDAQIESIPRNSPYSMCKYTCFASIKLTEEEVFKLLNFRITDVRLFVYDYELQEIEKKKAIEHLKCLIAAK